MRSSLCLATLLRIVGARSGALYHLADRGVDLLLRPLQRFLRLLHLLLLDGSAGGGGGGEVHATGCKRGCGDDGEKCFHERHYRRNAAGLPRQYFRSRKKGPRE